MKMRNAFALFAAMALALTLAGCGGGVAAGPTQSSGGGGGNGGAGAGSGGGSGSGSGGGSGGGGSTSNSACNVMSTGQGASLNGFLPFATNSPWNTDISSAPVDPSSTAMIGAIGPSIG